MKTYKFLVLIPLCGDEYVMDHLGPTEQDAIRDNLFQSHDNQMRVIECKHENLKDNLVTVDGEFEIDLLCDVNGALYYCEDILSKTDIINMFE